MSNYEFGESDYPLIRAVVRLRHVVPTASALVIVLLALYHSHTSVGITVAILLGGLGLTVVRLGVEVIELIADTLLPR